MFKSPNETAQMPFQYSNTNTSVIVTLPLYKLNPFIKIVYSKIALFILIFYFDNLVKNHDVGGSKMSQLVKSVMNKPDDLISISRIHMVEGKNHFLQVVL